MPEVTFVPASPGWDVLYYRGTDYTASPVIGWAIMVDEEGFVHSQPVTADAAWNLSDSRTIQFPDGSVILDGLEEWPTTAAWFAAMRERDKMEPEARRAAARERVTVVPESPSAPVLALDNYRRRFQDTGSE